MGRQAKTQNIIDTAHEILEAYHPMTVRQVYYQLVSRQVIENNRSRYQAVSNAIVDARLEGSIPWNWIEDRLRKPKSADGGYDNLADFAKYIQYYYGRVFWKTQSFKLEVWVEKDALSGVFSDALSRYRVTYNVGRGFDGWSSIYNASKRYGGGENVTVLYFGDFDPSGEEMVTSLRKRLSELGCNPEIRKVSLTKEEVQRYNLPYDFTKATDTRSKKFIEQYGDMAVELDALPAAVLQSRIVEEVEKYVDVAAIDAIEEIEKQEREKLVEVLRAIK